MVLPGLLVLIGHMLAIPYALALACLVFGVLFALWALAGMTEVLEDRPRETYDEDPPRRP